MSDSIIADLEVAASAAEASSLDPRGTVRVLVAAVRKAAADLKAAAPADDGQKPRRNK